MTKGKLTKASLWTWLTITIAIGGRLNSRGERLYQMMLRRNKKYGYPS